MKSKYGYIWISLVILVFGILFVPKIVHRIKSGTVVENDRLNRKDNSGELSYIKLNGIRRKVPPFTLVNQDSLVITEKDYLGKVWVVDFFFTSCPTICPIMTKNLKGIQNELQEVENFGIASITINPKYDSPTILKEYAERYKVDELGWNFLTGDREYIYDLANAGFNIYASQTPDVQGGFEHSGYFALIDKNGFLRSRVDNFGNPLVYYKGTITKEEGTDEEGEKEQISMLTRDIKKLLEE